MWLLQPASNFLKQLISVGHVSSLGACLPHHCMVACAWWGGRGAGTVLSLPLCLCSHTGNKDPWIRWTWTWQTKESEKKRKYGPEEVWEEDSACPAFLSLSSPATHLFVWWVVVMWQAFGVAWRVWRRPTPHGDMVACLTGIFRDLAMPCVSWRGVAAGSLPQTAALRGSPLTPPFWRGILLPPLPPSPAYPHLCLRFGGIWRHAWHAWHGRQQQQLLFHFLGA